MGSKKTIKIPKLPYGQGSMSIRSDGLIMYRKRFGNPKKEHTVYGETPRECMDKMSELEKTLKKQIITPDKITLSDAMYDWSKNVMKNTQKEQSNQRLNSTIKNQIEKSNIGFSRFQNITSDELQKLINELNQKNYSHSVIKKTFDALNAFYRYASVKYNFDNPMLLVVMPTTNNIKAETRIVEFFEQEI